MKLLISERREGGLENKMFSKKGLLLVNLFLKVFSNLSCTIKLKTDQMGVLAHQRSYSITVMKNRLALKAYSSAFSWINPSF
jgi:hypothetical protein